MSSINTSFIICLSIILLGFVGKKTSLVREADGEGISRIIFNITLPATVINTFSTMKVDLSLLSLSALCLVYGLFMTGLGLFVFRKQERKMKGMLSMLVPPYNIGLFAYPLVEAVWGKEGLKYFGMFDMGNALLIFGISYIIASVYATESPSLDIKSILRKVFSSIPLLAYIITLIINLTGLSFPALILNMAAVLSRANMALSLLLLGIYLSFNFDKAYWKKMIQVILIRYIPGLLLGIALYLFLPFEPMFRITLLVGFSLPIGLAVIPYSVQFDYDKKFVGTICNITMIISFFLIWLAALIVSG